MALNGVYMCLLASSGIAYFTSSLVMKLDARPANLPSSLSLFEHIVLLDDNADAKPILTSWPSVDWKRPLGSTMNVLDEDVFRLSWTEAVDLVQNGPL